MHTDLTSRVPTNQPPTLRHLAGAVLAVALAAWAPAALGQQTPNRQIFFAGQPVELTPYTDRLAVRFTTAADPATRQSWVAGVAGVGAPRLVETIERLNIEIYSAELSPAAVVRSSGVVAERIAYASPIYRSLGIDLIPTGEVFVQFADGRGPAGLAEILGTEALELVRATPWLADNYLVRITPATSGDALTVAERLLARTDVVFSQPNFVRKLTRMDVPDDPLFGRQWGLDNTGQAAGGVTDPDLDAPEGWCIEKGCNVVIAILDEGCDMNHPDYVGKLVTGYDAVDGDNWPQPNPWDGHGTACAGVAAAETNNALGVAGVSWAAQIMPIRIAYSPAPGTHYWITTDQWLSDSLAWAWQNGAHVLSNSWGGGPPSEQIHAAIRAAVITGRGNAGAIVVFAAGNDDQAQASYPGRHPEAICVAATSPCDERKSPASCDGEYWWGSNYGDGVDLAAPGVHVPTTDISGADGYCPSPGGSFDCSGGNDYVMNFNGTSSATPYVAGVAAVLLCQYPTYREKEIRARLEQTCDKVGGYGYDPITGRSFELGYGRVNLYRALSGKPQVVGGPLPAWPSIYRDVSDLAPDYPDAQHESAACEWLGEEYSPEVDVNDARDPDGKPNRTQQDGFDDGVEFFPPYIPGMPGMVKVTVSVEEAQGLRYATDKLYVNVWFDWQDDGDFNNTFDWMVQNQLVDPVAFGGSNTQTFTYTFLVPDIPVAWHLQSAQPGRFLNVRTRLSYAQVLMDAYMTAEAGEVEDDQFLNFVEMFLLGPGFMNIVSYGCDQWQWVSGFEPYHPCVPGFMFNPPTGYMTAEVYFPSATSDYHSGLQTPSFDLSELTEAFLEYDYSAVEIVTGYVNVYSNGVLDATVRTYPYFPFTGCPNPPVFHEIVDISGWCGEGHTDIVIEFRTYPPDPCPIVPADYQDWQLDNVVVWGRDVIAPDTVATTVTPTSAETADLDWTAPGDDGVMYTAELYNIRYGPRAVTAANWRHSLWLPPDMAGGTLPVPAPPGTAESAAVTGLSPGLHFFSARTLDEVNNIAAVGSGGRNRPPTVAAPGALTVIAGDQVVFQVQGTDPDMDPLMMLASNLPSGASFVDNYDNTADFEWHTTAFDVGLYTVIFQARDPNGRSASASTTIDVTRSGLDCNTNGIDDTDDIINYTSPDCQPNGVPDECDVASGQSADCQADNIPDECQLTLLDCNGSGRPDECDPKGDFDLDLDIDAADYADFWGCFTGPCLNPPCHPTLYLSTCCWLADFDGDGDVDLTDFAAFTRAYTGP